MLFIPTPDIKAIFTQKYVSTGGMNFTFLDAITSEVYCRSFRSSTAGSTIATAFDFENFKVQYKANAAVIITCKKACSCYSVDGTTETFVQDVAAGGTLPTFTQSSRFYIFR